MNALRPETGLAPRAPSALRAVDPRPPLRLRLARAYTRRALRRAFEGVYVQGLPALRARMAEGPVLVAATHVAWWDPLVLVALDEALGGVASCPMDARNFDSLPFFRWVGAWRLDLSTAETRAAGIDEGVARLRAPGDCLFLFPQGRQRPPGVRPLDLKRGVRDIARAAQVPVVPLALSYVWRQGPKPAVALHLGEALAPSAVTLEALEAALVDGLDRNDRLALEGRTGWTPLLGRAARHDDGVGTRVLQWLTGGRGRRP